MIDITFYQFLLICLCYLHLTFVAYELYIHRSITHNAVNFNKGISLVFEFWLWLTTGLPNKYYICSHRIHHAYADTKKDIHGPAHLGVNTQFLKKPFYRIYEKLKSLVIITDKKAFPPTDLQKKFLKDIKPYCSKFFIKNEKYGNLLFLLSNFILFGFNGILLYLCFIIISNILQHIIIDGLGHYIGYRNYNSNDNSKNILPFGILLNGSELHNNHHGNPGSANNRVKWYEIDIGWMYIKTFMFFKMCTINKNDH